MQNGFAKQLLITTLFSIVNGLISQISPVAHFDNSDTLKLNLRFLAGDLSNEKSMGFIPLFKTDGIVHSYMDVVGADFNNIAETHQIILPDSNKHNYYYGYVFQEHESNVFEPNRLIFLLENGKYWWNYNKSRVWFDRNHDFDFNNEKPDTFYKGKSNIIYFDTGDSKGSGLKLERFPAAKFHRFTSMNDLSIKELKGPREFIGTRFSLKETRFNILYDLVKFRNDSLIVGLMDVNQNGVFTDEGIDRWVISPFSEHFADTKETIPFESNSHLSWLGFQFELRKSSFPKFEFVRSDKRCSKNTLINGTKIPSFRYCQVNKGRSSKKSSRKSGGKAQVFIIWSADNERFANDSAMVHRLSRVHKDIHWVFLNFGGSGRYVGGYNRRFDLDVTQGFCSSRIAEKLKIQTLPQYYYFDEEHRLVATGKGLDELNHLIPNVDK